MDRIFRDIIGDIIDVYVDDMVVISRTELDHITNLDRVFSLLRKHDLNLNPDECNYGVPFGKILRFMLTSIGIEAWQDKCHVVINMPNPTRTKEVQLLVGRIVAL